MRNRLSGSRLIAQVGSPPSSSSIHHDERGSAQFGPDATTARELAEAAGRLLLQLRTTMPPGSELRDAGDQMSHRFLVDELSKRLPADRVLSEEGAHQEAAGFHATRLDGSPLVYDRPDPWLPDLLICRPDLAKTVITICRELA